MAQRLLLLGVVGSGLALNAFGISHFNTSEMSSMFDTGTGNAGSDSSAEADTGGRPGFDVKAMVKNFFKAGNHLLVPMEVQTNRRLGRILQHIMAEVREATNVQHTSPKCCLCSGKIETREGRCPVYCKQIKETDCTPKDVTPKDVNDRKKEGRQRLRNMFEVPGKKKEAETGLDKVLNEEKDRLQEKKSSVMGQIEVVKKDGSSRHLENLKNKKTTLNNQLKELNTVKKRLNEVAVDEFAEVEESIKKQDKKPAGCKNPDAAPETLKKQGKKFDYQFSKFYTTTDSKEQAAMGKARDELFRWFDTEGVAKNTANRWCTIYRNRHLIERQNGEELVQYWQCGSCKGGSANCKKRFKDIFSDCQFLDEK